MGRETTMKEIKDKVQVGPTIMHVSIMWISSSVVGK